MDAVVVDGLSESFRRRGFKRRSLRAILTRRQPLRAPRVFGLTGISFAVSRGEMIGVVGPNGSGKTTLLRCLAGIYKPSSGSITVRGTTASLIDLSAGFLRELSARDNVLLAGALHGIPHAELTGRLDEILEFAGLPDQEETPLRAFSAGMAMRLGFSLAVIVEPDLLLVDEVLAVGDEGFKLKCIEKIRNLRASGSAVMFVSHDLALVRSLCERLIVLDGGTVAYDGEVERGLRVYSDILGVELEQILHRAPLDEEQLIRIERAWKTRG